MFAIASFMYHHICLFIFSTLKPSLAFVLHQIIIYTVFSIYSIKPILFRLKMHICV